MSNSAEKDRMGVGEIIRREREKKGITIEQLSDMTKISKEFIKAIEEENFDLLPGDVYTGGFIRNISMVLGLDPEEMRRLYKSQRKREYEQEVIKEAVETLPQYDTDVDKGVKPKRPWLVILLVLLLLAGGAFYLYASRTGTLVSLTKSFVKGEPERQATSSVSIASSAKEEKATLEEPATMETAAVSSVSTETKAISVEEGLATSPAAVSTGSASSPQEIEEINLKVIAIGRCWIRVIADGKKIYEGTLVKGDEKSWEAKEKIKVRFGNIGGVKVYFNGKEVSPPSGKGGVVDMTFPPEPEEER